MGAGREGFAYDNERPRHQVDVAGFRDRPHGRSTNATWLRFAEGGGYERREWWSDEGWAWKEAVRHHRTRRRPSAATRTRPRATSPGSRPTPSPAPTARACRPRPSGRGRRPGAGAERSTAIGEVWEWTAAEFAGYPGFVAHPYREYSEVFFGDGYRVLRGGSWATAPARRHPHFRNWDLPQRRQIFAGVRLARERVMEPVTPADAPRAAIVDRLATSTAGTSARSPTTCSTG